MRTFLVVCVLALLLLRTMASIFVAVILTRDMVLCVACPNASNIGVVATGTMLMPFGFVTITISMPMSVPLLLLLLRVVMTGRKMFGRLWTVKVWL
jgi:hypothetical protein